jgi:hypothetical protein
MGFWLRIIKKIWNGILNVISWLTQYSPRLNSAKRKTNVEREATEQHWRYNTWR